MKTLNLNKILLLACLFTGAAFFSNGVNAACVTESDGTTIKTNTDLTTSGSVQDDLDPGVGSWTETCDITPDVYQLTFYKIGICTSSTTLNDLSSCQMILDDATGIMQDVEKGVSGSMSIPEFTVNPGTYPFMVVVLSNKLGMKIAFKTSNPIDGVSGDTTGGSGTDDSFCWTSVAGPSSMTNENIGSDSVHGATLAANTPMIDCDDEAYGTAVFSYEVVPKFSDMDCTAAFADFGDRTSFDNEFNGIPTVSLLTTADAFATTCKNAAKILWTTTLTSPYIVTENSSFSLNIKATNANALTFSDGGSDNNVIKLSSMAPKLYLTVTN